jgi:AcrR family transcriptional regulator
MKSAAPKLSKRDAVLDAATRLFALQGYENTEVDAIAAAAGVAKGTIYFHFQTKEKLFLAVADYGMRRLSEHILKSMEGLTDIVEVLRTAGVQAACFFQKHPELVEILLQERAQFRGSIPDTHLLYREKNRHIFEPLVQQGVEQRIFRDIDVSEALTMGANMLFGLVVTSCVEGRSKDINRRARFAVDLWLSAVLRSPRESMSRLLDELDEEVD